MNTPTNEWKVAPNESGLKLLAFLKSKLPLEVTARHLKRSIEAGHCLLNGQIEKFATRLVGSGDRIAFTVAMENKATRDPSSSSKERILYLDDHLLAYNKPPGISSEIDLLKPHLKAYFPLILLHRLDRNTSGVLLFARNEKVAEAMFKLFKQRQITKMYNALVDGIPKKSNGIIENFLGKIHTYQGGIIWGAVSSDKGLPAKTTWNILSKGKNASFLSCLPETGRTHQIRIHLRDLGHPVLGDYQYGKVFHCAYRPPRLMLHASEVSFTHPITNDPVTIQAPIPNDFIATMDAVLSKESK